MTQVPAPPIPPDPNLIISQIVPIFGMLTGIVITGFIALGPVGRAIGDVIRHLFGAHRKDAALKPGDTDEIIGRLEAIQSHIGDLAERQDFS